MESFHQYLGQYRDQLARGDVQRAYRGLMAYMMHLRTWLARRHPEFAAPGSIYHGYMDMTYFSFSPPALGQRGLKTAVVFLHEAFRFEVWLAGANKQVQAKYWHLLKTSGWSKYRLVPTTQGADAIVEHVLEADPDFQDLDALSAHIESGAVQFASDVEHYLAGLDQQAA